MAKRQTAAQKRAELKKWKKVEQAEKAAARKARKLDPAADHTYGEGSHTVGNVVIHGLAHYNAARTEEIAAWLDQLSSAVRAGIKLETFAARYNVRNL